MAQLNRPFPLILAAFEARFDDPLSPEAFEHLAQTVFADLQHVLPDTNWATTSEDVVKYTTRVAEFSDPERSRAVGIRADLLRLEVGTYEGHERFRDLVSQVLVAVERSRTVQGFSRIGFRTVDEISLPWSGRDPRQWRGMIAEQLLAPLDLFDNSPDIERFSGTLQFVLSDEHRIKLSYGALPRPALRISPARLRTRPRKSPGGVFMIDIDSYSVQETAARQDSTEAVLKQLQAPIDSIFQACVTDLYHGYHRQNGDLGSGFTVGTDRKDL